MLDHAMRFLNRSNDKDGEDEASLWDSFHIIVVFIYVSKCVKTVY